MCEQALPLSPDILDAPRGDPDVAGTSPPTRFRATPAPTYRLPAGRGDGTCGPAPCAIGHVRAPQRALPASGVPVRKEATDRDWGDCDCAVGSPDGNIVYLRSCSPPYENKMSFNTLGVCERKDPQAGGLGRDQRVPGCVRPL